MSECTPGPWFHSNTSMWGCVTTQPDGHGHVIAEVNAPPTGGGSLDPNRVAEVQANARLIASAPDLRAQRDELAEALREVVASVGSFASLHKARAALAKVVKP